MRKAFDTVNKNVLFAKLFKYKIQGNILQLLQCMYKEVYYSIKLPDGLSDKISYTVGIK